MCRLCVRSSRRNLQIRLNAMLNGKHRIVHLCLHGAGTSVASPVVAGAVCLLASTVPEKNRWSLLNPASMKQVGGADVTLAMTIHRNKPTPRGKVAPSLLPHM